MKPACPPPDQFRIGQLEEFHRRIRHIETEAADRKSDAGQAEKRIKSVIELANPKHAA